MRRQGDRGYGIIVVMHWFFGQQPGLRPEPRKAAQGTSAAVRCGVGAVVGARGRCPPVEVDRRRGA